MYFKIQIDWNKYIVLPMNKNTAESIQSVFGDPDNVWELEYDRTRGIVGQGLVPASNWKPNVTLMRGDEYRELMDIGEYIAKNRADENTQEAA